MREQLLKKQRELLELQKKKIELELLQAKASLEQQQRQLDKQAGNLKTEIVSCIYNRMLVHHVVQNIVIYHFSLQQVTSTAHVPPTTEAATSGKTVASTVPNQTPIDVTKQVSQIHHL